jgi:TatD DNase family protein
MKLTDTHSHLYHKSLQPDIENIIERCKQQRVAAVILPNINEESVAPMNELAKKSDDEIKFFPAMGLHPCDVGDDVDQQLVFFSKELEKGNYVAIGETGLDYYWDVTRKSQQQLAFTAHIQWAAEKNLPLIVHSRHATSDCIRTLQLFGGKTKGVFHCFAGNFAEAMQVIDLGWYIGIGGSITYKNSTELNEVIKKIDMEHIVLETDSPYLPPVPHRGKRNESSYVSLVAQYLAILKNMSVEAVAEITTENAKKLFGINI